MKIRTDFVTNSSSSSFILGKPDGDTTQISDAKKYLQSIESQINRPSKCDYIIDLRYDPKKKYSIEEVQFVVEAILWYSAVEHSCTIDINTNGEAYVTADNGDCVFLHCYEDYYFDVEIKAIYDYAYHHYGEILVGNYDEGFYPPDLFWEIIAKDTSI